MGNTWYQSPSEKTEACFSRISHVTERHSARRSPHEQYGDNYITASSSSMYNIGRCLYHCHSSPKHYMVNSVSPEPCIIKSSKRGSGAAPILRIISGMSASIQNKSSDLGCAFNQILLFGAVPWLCWVRKVCRCSG